MTPRPKYTSAPVAVTALATVAILAIASAPTIARGEEVTRIALWTAEGATEDDVAEARERLAQLGELVELPTPAPAPLSEERESLRAEVSVQLERAQSFYYEAQFAEAARILEQYTDERMTTLARAGCYESLRHVLLWLGVTLGKVGQTTRSIEWFTSAITLGQSEIDRALFPPEVTRLFDQARERLDDRERRSIPLELSPSHADVELDGQPRALTEEAAIDMTLGRHLLVVRQRGFRAEALLLAIGEDEPRSALTIALEPLEGDAARAEVAALRHEGELDITAVNHLQLIAGATNTQLIAHVGDDGQVTLRDPEGHPRPLPALFAPAESDRAESVDTLPVTTSEEASTPAWRRWWFWVALLGGTAALVTGVALGVGAGDNSELVFTLRPPQTE